MKNPRTVGSGSVAIVYEDGVERYIDYSDSQRELTDDIYELSGQSAWGFVIDHIVNNKIRIRPNEEDCQMPRTAVRPKTITKRGSSPLTMGEKIGCASAVGDEVVIFEEVIKEVVAKNHPFENSPVFEPMKTPEINFVILQRPDKIIHHALYVNKAKKIGSCRSRQPRDKGHEKNKRRQFPMGAPNPYTN